MCYERLDIGMNPACVNARPVGALSIIDLDADPVPDNAVQYPPWFPHMPQLNPERALFWRASLSSRRTSNGKI